MYDIEKIKEELTIEQVMEFVDEFGGESREINDNSFVCKTICHNELGEGSHKLYYYDNTKLFKCFTECDSTFDIFELVIKIFGLRGQDLELFQAIELVARFFGISDLSFQNQNFIINDKVLIDSEILNFYQKIIDKEHIKKEYSFNILNKDILKRFSKPIIYSWFREGISKDICDNRGIAFDAESYGVVIPHYDINNNLIGIRERTMVKELEKFGKYRPAIIKKVMYNHPLGFNLYNLNNSKDNIKNMGMAIVYEGEKSCLKHATYFGEENDISVATCGDSLTNRQMELLIESGAKEVVVAYDRQYQNIGDKESLKWIKKLQSLNDKFKNKVQISFIFDKENLLDYKDSPIDKGKDVLLKLLKERIIL